MGSKKTPLQIIFSGSQIQNVRQKNQDMGFAFSVFILIFRLIN